MNSNKIILIYSMLIVILIVKLSRLSEYGYDYLASFVLISIFIIYFVLKIEKYKVLICMKYILFYLYLLFNKITSILFLLFLFIFLFQKKINLKKLNLAIFYLFLYFQ